MYWQHLIVTNIKYTLQVKQIDLIVNLTHQHFYIKCLTGLFFNRPHLSWSVHLKSCAISFESPDLCNSASHVSVDCPLEEVAGDPYAFMLGNKTMDCAPGTLFNLTVCTCVHYGMFTVCSAHANRPLGLFYLGFRVHTRGGTLAGSH